MGRVFRIRKRFCHLTIYLEGEADIVEPAVKSAEGDKKAAKVKKTKKISAKKTAKAKSGKSKATTAKAKTTAAKKTTTKAVKKGDK